MSVAWDVMAVLLDDQWFNSPFVVPLAGCAMIGSIAVARIWSGVRTREIRSQERLARIAQGLPVEPEMEEAAAATAPGLAAGGGTPSAVRRPNDGGGARRAGVVLSGVGLGLILFFVALALIVQVREVLSGAAAGLIPLAIGVGFLVDARAKRQEFERYMEWERYYAGAAAAAGQAAGFGVPPPPPPPPSSPESMSAAQASDWRPLH